jgi:hypothetical protein
MYPEVTVHDRPTWHADMIQPASADEMWRRRQRGSVQQLVHPKKKTSSFWETEQRKAVE